MGFLGFTLLLWPIALPLILIESLLTNPAEFIEIVTMLPTFFLSLINGTLGVLLEYLPTQFGLPGIVEIISRFF